MIFHFYQHQTTKYLYFFVFLPHYFYIYSHSFEGSDKVPVGFQPLKNPLFFLIFNPSPPASSVSTAEGSKSVNLNLLSCFPSTQKQQNYTSDDVHEIKQVNGQLKKYYCHFPHPFYHTLEYDSHSSVVRREQQTHRQSGDCRQNGGQ